MRASFLEPMVLMVGVTTTTTMTALFGHVTGFIVSPPRCCHNRRWYPILTKDGWNEEDRSQTKPTTAIRSFFRNVVDEGPFDDDDDDDDNDDNEDDEEEDAYVGRASSEFDGSQTAIDWGAELGKLRQRTADVASGRSESEAFQLFSLLKQETPNEAIEKFVRTSNPEILAAMSGAVTGILGGLSNPLMGVDTLVTANGRQFSSLCFQLQMTGYMFRNAEYVVALKDLMRIEEDDGNQGRSQQQQQRRRLGGMGMAPRNVYREAFDRVDADGSGYIEADEIEDLLEEVYGENEVPAFETRAFLRFFDENSDGKISWEEFERGLGAMGRDRASAAIMGKRFVNNNNNNKQDSDDDTDNNTDMDEDDDEPPILPEPTVSGTIEVELKDGTVMKVQAKDYIQRLKDEAQALKEALQKAKKGSSRSRTTTPPQSSPSEQPVDASPEAIFGGNIDGNVSKARGSSNNNNKNNNEISSFLSSLGGDLQKLTENISPEVVEAMKLLIQFVLGNAPSSSSTSSFLGSGSMETAMSRDVIVGGVPEIDMDKEMELPGSALRQLALWQLVLGYKLREAEATGEYKRILDS